MRRKLRKEVKTYFAMPCSQLEVTDEVFKAEMSKGIENCYQYATSIPFDEMDVHPIYKEFGNRYKFQKCIIVSAENDFVCMLDAHEITGITLVPSAQGEPDLYQEAIGQVRQREDLRRHLRRREGKEPQPAQQPVRRRLLRHEDHVQDQVQGEEVRLQLHLRRRDEINKLFFSSNQSNILFIKTAIKRHQSCSRTHTCTHRQDYFNLRRHSYEAVLKR